MWIFQNNSFVSIVAHKDLPGQLLVRSRIKGDIEKAIPSAEVFEDTAADYRYRAIVAKDVVQEAIMKSISEIDYPNFKNSIAHSDGNRHDAYMGVWQVMARAFGAFGRK
jgi:hypothetical protein